MNIIITLLFIVIFLIIICFIGFIILNFIDNFKDSPDMNHKCKKNNKRTYIV